MVVFYCTTIQFVLEPDSFTRKGSGTFFVYRKFCGRATRNGKQERTEAGYHRGDGILPFVCGIKVALCELDRHLYGALMAIAAYVRTGSLYTSGKA